MAEFKCFEPKARKYPLAAYVADHGSITSHTKEGNFSVSKTNIDLVAMVPKPLRGLLVFHDDGNGHKFGKWWPTIKEAERDECASGIPIVAIIDLSQFREGYGL